MLEENKFLKAFVDAMHLGGSKCYELIRHSSILREDDVILTSAGFEKN